MSDILNELNLYYIGWPELLLRVGLAMLFGLVLGLDRDNKNKPIDFRAYMIVAVTTCIIAILGQELSAEFIESNDVVSLDLAKIISGVLTGIGFLGAGAIIHRSDDRVVGTATGASIWAAGGIGLALGFGFYGLAVIAFLAIGLILIGGGACMAKFQGKSDKESL
ncbi:MAG: MgtC/SapB family protein [Pseudomonadota bacterium]